MVKHRIYVTGLLLACISMSFLQQTSAAEINQTDGVAISGYDPVAYFKEGKPVMGSSSITHTWSGASWLFSSNENKNDFVADPKKYAPQFGGHCAMSMSKGIMAKADPMAWDIIDGRLYFNATQEVEEIWLKRSAELIKQADQNWLVL